MSCEHAKQHASLDAAVVGHERAEHRLKVTAACRQHSLVGRDAGVVKQQCHVTELSADTGQERLQITLQCVACHTHSSQYATGQLTWLSTISADAVCWRGGTNSVTALSTDCKLCPRMLPHTHTDAR